MNDKPIALSLALFLLWSCSAGQPQTSDPALVALKIRIDTERFTESRKFYSEILGLQILEEWDDDGDVGCILGFSSHGSTGFLELSPSDSTAQGSSDPLSLQFRTLDIQATAESLSGRWEFEGPVERPWGSTYLYLTDPDGISVILFEGDI